MATLIRSFAPNTRVAETAVAAPKNIRRETPESTISSFAHESISDNRTGSHIGDRSLACNALSGPGVGCAELRSTKIIRRDRRVWLRIFPLFAYFYIRE